MSLRAVVLGMVVLAVNAAILSVEMLATRLLFPHFGNTIFTWSSVISVIIAGLSVGYFIGGYLAQRSRGRELLVFLELLAGGLSVMACPWACKIVLLSVSAQQTLHPPLLNSFLVFGVPAAILAAILPAAVGLLSEEGVSPSLASGIVSGLSALGSIAGTLATTFYLVPAWGVRSLFTIYGALLGLAAAAFWLAIRTSRKEQRGSKEPRGSRAAILSAMAFFILAGCVLAPQARNLYGPGAGELIFARDSAYQLIRVLEHGWQGATTRMLLLDSTYEGALRPGGGDLVFPYTHAYKLFSNIFPEQAGARILYIGGGAFAMPVQTALALPRSTVEVAEIDPMVWEVGRKYFDAARPPNLSVSLGDGRQVLRKSPGLYDAAFVDAYQGLYTIPFHLTTREFFEEIRSGLAPEGFLGLNVIGDPLEKDGFFCAITGTLAEVFPWVRVYPVEGLQPWTQNVIVVVHKLPGGFGGNKDILAGARLGSGHALGDLRCRWGRTLTDDHAPVEWLVGKYHKK